MSESDRTADGIGAARGDRRLERLERENARLKEQLKRVEREKAEYLQNVSHQLVAPLNAIKWHIENITSARIGVERAKKVLRSIYSQATIAVHLAKNFALMSHLEADHALDSLKEPLQPVTLSRLLVNLADDFQPLAWEKEVQIGVELNPFADAPDVLVMKPLISQVFSNIIENAVKYSNVGSDIVISGSHDESTDTVTVVIGNHGIPLRREEIDSVFERGYRGNAALNTYPAGTGFGLYIARRIVELHEGAIAVDTDGRGDTEFSVTLSVSGLEGKARQREPKNRSDNRR